MGPGAQRWHAPKKYLSADSSGITVTMDGETSDLVINLTWDGGQPFVERFNKE